MGRFSTTVHISNVNHLTRDQFITQLNNFISSNGYCSSTQEDFQLTYFVAFSTNGKWITIGSNEYLKNSRQAFHDAKQNAESMQTNCICIEVVDSDFADIKLYNKSGTYDPVVVGTPYDEERVPPKGKKECWENLLSQGKTWEELLEIWNKDEVFVEDALYEAASIIGIEPKYIIFDFRDFEMTKDDANIVQLFFKKNQ